jgi:hypothetical protein
MIVADACRCGFDVKLIFEARCNNTSERASSTVKNVLAKAIILIAVIVQKRVDVYSLL